MAEGTDRTSTAWEEAIEAFGTAKKEDCRMKGRVSLELGSGTAELQRLLALPR